MNLSKNPPSSGELKTLSEKTNNSLKKQIKEVKTLLDSANQKITDILNKELKNATADATADSIKTLLNETQEKISLEFPGSVLSCLINPCFYQRGLSF